MKKYTVLGNCQSIAISNTLNSCFDFRHRYEHIYIPPVHTIDKYRDIHLLENLLDIDLLIYQPVIDQSQFGMFTSKSILSLLKSGALSICIPSMYYSGYFPTIASMDNVVSALRGVHDYLIVYAFLAGYSANDAVVLLKSGFPLSFKDIEKLHVSSLNALRNREQNFKVDIKISDFIGDSYKNIRLFHTFNHPTVELVNYICHEICKNIHIEFTYHDNDYLSEIIAPIYENVHQGLKLNFKQQKIMYKNSELSLSEMVIFNYEVYSRTSKATLIDSLNKNKNFINQLLF